jgi:hypothetical protein
MSTATSAATQTARSMTAIRKALREAAGTNYQPDNSVAQTDGTQINVPRTMTLQSAAVTLAAAAQAQEQEQDFVKVFKARPWDGAWATLNVMREFFGTTGRGTALHSFFGSVKPRMMSVEIGFGQHAEVPWGRLEAPLFEGALDFSISSDPSLGYLFELTVTAPKKHEAAIVGFFRLIEDWLSQRSIYKGKAILGTANPTFLPPYTESSIVYTEQVNALLETAVWGVIRNREVLKDDQRKVNTRTLLFGPYGTGKSEAGRMTADVAVRHGVTFIQVESGASLEDLEQSAATARLLAPAVLFVEDVDLLVNDGSEGSAQQARVLELFDGISSKSDGVMILMTSNKAATFSKGMLRAGRVDQMIEVGALDRPATEVLIRKVIGSDRLAPDLDFDTVWKAVEDFEPAFVRAVFDQAGAAALMRSADRLRAEGFDEEDIRRLAPEYVLDTGDFVAAANLLRPQHDMHAAKSDEISKDPLSEILQKFLAEAVEEALTSGVFVANDHGPGLVFQPGS